MLNIIFIIIIRKFVFVIKHSCNTNHNVYRVDHGVFPFLSVLTMQNTGKTPQGTLYNNIQNTCVYPSPSGTIANYMS